MKSAFVFLLITILVTPSFFAYGKPAPVPRKIEPKEDYCTYCVDFMNDAISDLEELILVVGGCGDICELLPDSLEVVACYFICTYVGFQAFIDALNETDPDPIYVCQVMDLCPVVNNGAAKITDSYVTPSSGRIGTVFTITMDYVVINSTGPGGQAVSVIPPDASFPMGDFEFTEGQTPGSYQVQWTLQAEPSEFEDFAPGIYQVQVFVCEGDCSTDHRWGGVYAQANTNFTIVA